MRNALVFSIVLMSLGVLQAHTCKDLCERFGDYEGCRKMERGVVDCTRRISTLPEVKEAENRGAALQNGTRTSTHRFILYTPWFYTGSMNARFQAKVTDRGLRYSGESREGANPYGLIFDGASFGDDHMIGADEMECRQVDPVRYHCIGKYGEYREATIEFRNQGDGRFELKFYGVPMEGNGSMQYKLRLASDGRFLYEEYFRNGRLRRDISKRYPVERIVPLP